MDINTTNIGTQYRSEKLENPIGASHDNTILPLWVDHVREPDIREASSGPEVQFEVEEHNFQSLVSKLLEFERPHECSSVEMFSQYLNDALPLHEGIEEWLDMFILFLGTKEIRRFSCP